EVFLLPFCFKQPVLYNKDIVCSVGQRRHSHRMFNTWSFALAGSWCRQARGTRKGTFLFVEYPRVCDTLRSMSFLDKVFGDESSRTLKRLQKRALEVNEFESSIQALSDEELKNKTV